MLYKKAIDLTGLDSGTKSYLSKLSNIAKSGTSGIACDKVLESLPNFISAPCENVIRNENNAFIVLGRDRPQSRLSGYGGKGDTHAASIDIVAGRQGYKARKVDEGGNQVFVDPDFQLDAARIYISQKTDIDKNFQLVNGSVGSAVAKSAVALKADGIRLIAREGIKLVTGVDKKNSQGGDIQTITGVDIIAGNDDLGLQPMLKGDNTRAALETLATHVDKLSGILDAFLISQMTYNAEIANHFHNTAFFGLPSTPSFIVQQAGARCLMDQLTRVKKSLVNYKINMASFKINYLAPYGSKYICSRNNKVN